MKDVNFHTNDGGFNFRVAAYITCGDKMLIQHADDVDFVNLVGGRVHLGENTVDAFKREIKEELGVVAKKPKLMVVAENFFEWRGEKAHELLFVYQIELSKKYFKQLEGARILDHDDQYVEWIEKNKIKNYVCKPTLIYRLPKLEKETHIFHVI